MMIKDEDKELIKKEFRKELLKAEKENLAQLNQKSDFDMVNNLKKELERLIKEYEDNKGDN